jgi:single-strand DNA-binding protein
MAFTPFPPTSPAWLILKNHSYPFPALSLSLPERDKNDAAAGPTPEPDDEKAIFQKEILMASYNKVILMGHLTRDPQGGQLPSGTPVCEFGLAVNRQWKGKDGSGAAKEEVLFIDCTAFGKVGQAIATHLTKGRAIHVEGHLKLDQWEAQDGGKRSKIRVIVEQFRFVDGKGQNDSTPETSGHNRVNGTVKGRGGKRPTGGKTATRGQTPEANAAPVREDIPF